MDKKCAIFAAGEYDLKEKPDLTNTLILAADAGVKHLKKIGVKPHVVIGDFDSNKKIPTNYETIVHPVIKDDTDTMLCVKYALERGCEVICLYGCLGGSFDHSIANLQTLSYIAEHGAVGYIISNDTSVVAIKNSSLFFSEKGRFSVFSMCGIAEGVKIRGSKYDCDKLNLTPTFPLGVSNEFLADFTEISVENGIIHVFWAQNHINRFPKIKRI